MSTLYTRSYDHEITYRDRPRQIRITIVTKEDDTDPAGNFDFGDADENAKYLARFESGEFLVAWIRVEASYLGVKGSDSLGACHMKASDIEGETDDTIDSHGMIENAIKQLTDELDLLRAALT